MEVLKCLMQACTDEFLAMVTEGVVQCIQGCDLVVIQCNMAT